MIPIACINEVVFGSLPRLLTVKGCLDKGSIGEKKNQYEFNMELWIKPVKLACHVNFSLLSSSDIFSFLH